MNSYESQVMKNLSEIGITPLTWRYSALDGDERDSNLLNIITDCNLAHERHVSLLEKWEDAPGWETAPTTETKSLSHVERALFVAGVIQAGGDPTNANNLPWKNQNSEIVLEGRTPLEWGRRFYARKFLNEWEKLNGKQKWIDKQEKRKPSMPFLNLSPDEEEAKLSKFFILEDMVCTNMVFRLKNPRKEHPGAIVNVDALLSIRHRRRIDAYSKMENNHKALHSDKNVSDTEKFAKRFLSDLESNLGYLPTLLPVTYDVAEKLSACEVPMEWLHKDVWIAHAQKMDRYVSKYPERFKELAHEINDFNRIELKKLGAHVWQNANPEKRKMVIFNKNMEDFDDNYYQTYSPCDKSAKHSKTEPNYYNDEEGLFKLDF